MHAALHTSLPDVQKMLKWVCNSCPLTGCTWHVRPAGTGLVCRNSWVRPRNLLWDSDFIRQKPRAWLTHTNWLQVQYWGKFDLSPTCGGNYLKLTGSDFQHVSAPGGQTEGLNREQRGGDSWKDVKGKERWLNAGTAAGSRNVSV